jgi:hypothetical protein
VLTRRGALRTFPTGNAAEPAGTIVTADLTRSTRLFAASIAVQRHTSLTRRSTDAARFVAADLAGRAECVPADRRFRVAISRAFTGIMVAKVYVDRSATCPSQESNDEQDFGRHSTNHRLAVS